ncbi:DUF1707 SHOCT-like domain-containing protein [Streptomyces sp. O3]
MTDDDLPELRASDADRERVAERLRDAVAEGRLDMEEFEQRLDAAYKARTYGDLEPLTRDLPATGAPAPASATAPAVSGSWASRIGGEPTSTGACAIMCGFQRKGVWTAPPRFTAFALMGGGEIDLRDAHFSQRETVINCVALMGGLGVVVPPGVEVRVRGFGLMGGFDSREDGVPGDPGAPRVIIKGFALWGGVSVTRKESKARRKAAREERRQARLEKRSERGERNDSRELG